MVDIHSHVLHGVDDGARTIEDSVSMLTLAADAGTTDIVATSHANTEYVWDRAIVDVRVKEIQAAAGNRIRVHPGCEMHLTFDNINDAIANPKKYTIAHKQWLLVEFSDFIIFQNTSDILHRLRDAGMLPIIAHPERNQILQNRFDSLVKWVEEGAYLQLTAQSLLGTFGVGTRKFSERLIEKGLVHFVASDAHDSSYRVPKLDEAHKWLAARYGQDYANALTVDNPFAAIEGAYIDPVSPPQKRGKKWLGIFR